MSCPVHYLWLDSAVSLLCALRCRPAPRRGGRDDDKERSQAQHRGKQQKAMMAAMKKVGGLPGGKGKHKGEAAHMCHVSM